MKHLSALLLFVVAMACQVTAQNASSAAPRTGDETTAREATDRLAAKYKLDADQAKQMYTIQMRKLRNAAEIAPLQSTDAALYRTKVQNLQKGTLASIRRILHTKEQVDLYQKTQISVRTQQSDKRKEMMLNGAGKEAIEAALLDIYSE
ncbi:MAG: hypothetical protein JNM22_09615 [Saprospiraceae bacterium]|nr:hypothetical protein [Saprospiraceae bacterium]